MPRGVVARQQLNLAPSVRKQRKLTNNGRWLYPSFYIEVLSRSAYDFQWFLYEFRRHWDPWIELALAQVDHLLEPTCRDQAYQSHKC